MAELVSMAEVQTYLRTDHLDTDPEYALLDGLRVRASAWARSWCGRPLLYEELWVYVDGTGETTLLLPDWPVIYVWSVEVDGTAFTEFDWNQAGELWRKDGTIWPMGRKNIVVGYTVGYGATSDELPQDIKQAVLTVIKAWYRRDVEDFSVTEQAGEYAYLPPEVPGLAKQLLAPYRRHVFGAA